MKEQKGFAITSMVLGVVSLALTLCCCGFYRAVAGIIMCSITVVLSILFIIL